MHCLSHNTCNFGHACYECVCDQKSFVFLHATVTESAALFVCGDACLFMPLFVELHSSFSCALLCHCCQLSLAGITQLATLVHYA